jgi:colanic acid biosynthesis glycosyl transferase WcaI
MRLLLLSRYYPPEIGAAAALYADLARGLCERGNAVTVVTGFPWYNLARMPQRYVGKAFLRENMDGVEVVRVRLPAFGSRALKLALGHMTAPLAAVVGGLMVSRPDAIVVHSPPLTMGVAGWMLKRVWGAALLLNVQDLHPQCYIDQGVLRNRIVINIWEALERFCYAGADVITVHSDGNRRHVVELKHAAADKVHVLHNWIDADKERPLPRDNAFAREHGLTGKFVVGYAGTLGMSQGMMTVVEAAVLLRGRDDVLFFIVGDGIDRERLEARVREYGLQNVRFLGMQPREMYPWVVASCDTGLIILNARVRTPVVPSKMLSYMAGGRPIIASVPLEGDVPRFVNEAGCGVCVPPGNPQALARAVVDLADAPDACRRYAAAGRAFVQTHCSLREAAEAVERLVMKRIR